MSKNYSDDELKIISLYKEGVKSSVTRMVEGIVNTSGNISGVGSLINPCEKIDFRFYLEGATSNNLFGSNMIDIRESVGENLINNISENVLLNLVDHRWVGDTRDEINLLNVMFQRKKLKLIAKAINDYIDFEALNQKDYSYKSFNKKIFDQFFGSIYANIPRSNSNFFEENKELDAAALLDAAINCGERILDFKGELSKKTTLNEKLNVVSTSIYNFLQIAVVLDDVNLFKRLFFEIPVMDRVIFIDNLNSIDKEKVINKYIFNDFSMRKNVLKVSLIENMVLSGSFNILTFLKNEKFEFNFEKINIFSKTTNNYYNFIGNIKDLLIFKLIDNASYFGRVSTVTHYRASLKSNYVNMNNKIFNCLSVFDDVSLNKAFFKSDNVLKIIGFLSLCGTKSLLDNILNLVPEIKEEKMDFYGSNLTLKEAQIVIFLFQKSIEANGGAGRVKGCEEHELLHFLNIDDLMVTKNDIKKKNYNMESVYISLSEVCKKVGYNKQEIDRVIFEQKINKAELVKRMTKI